MSKLIGLASNNIRIYFRRNSLFRLAHVPYSHRTASLLTGRDGQKLLKYVDEHPELELNYREAMVWLYRLSAWAIAAPLHVDDQAITDARELVDSFSTTWRAAGLPAHNKLYLFEAHLADFIEIHGSWGLFGEQSRLLLNCVNFSLFSPRINAPSR
jgi:hypothetical protein